MNATSRILLTSAMAVAFSVAPRLTLAQTIIDDDFDGAKVTGWVSQGNIRTATHTISQADSIITSEVAAIQRDTNRGIISETSFEPNAVGGFTMTFVADSVSHPPQANGYFIGLVRENTVFHRDASTKNFGLVFYGQDARTGSSGGFGLAYGDNNAANSSDFQIANSDIQGDVDAASFFDGFTATVSVDPVGWTYEITGLLDAGLVDKTFTDSGTWADAGTTFDALWPAGQEWFIMAALQHSNIVAHSIAFDRITLVGGSGGGNNPFRILSAIFDHDPKSPSATVIWTSRTGAVYNIDFSTDLRNWSEIDDGVESDGDTTEYLHEFLPSFPELIGATKIFYRIRQG